MDDAFRHSTLTHRVSGKSSAIFQRHDAWLRSDRASFARPAGRAALYAGVFYKDPMAALDWLERAFGFRRSVLVTDGSGNLVHSEMRFGEAYVIIDNEWSELVASPLSVGGRNTQSVYLRLADGLDDHCERARSAGARIVQEPEDQPYGDRTYRALDPEGHVWTFSQTVRHVSREVAERDNGWVIEGWHQDR